MKIVEISDYDIYNSRVANWCCEDQEVQQLYDFDEYRANRGTIAFKDRLWFVGCAPKLVIKFDNGATETFEDLTDRLGHANPPAIKNAMKRISDLLLTEDDPYTDMPDIF